MTDLDDLERLARDATPEKWFLGPNGINVLARISEECDGREYVFDRVLVSSLIRHRRRHDMAYIAAANPSAIIDIIARCREAEARVAELGEYIAQRKWGQENIGARQAVPEWQPMDTAPKDGTRILLKGYGATVVAGWGRVWEAETEGWCIVNDAWIHPDDATNWMPLPAATSPGGENHG